MRSGAIKRLWHGLAGWWVALFVLGSGLLAASAPGRLEWRTKENTVDADIDGWPLQQLLEKVAAKTRWRVYVEPRTQHTVTAKFKELKPGEALRRLLGDLSFVFLPSTNGPARLYIFRTSMQTATNLVAAPAEQDNLRGKSRRIPNELVVVLKPGASESIDELARRLGATVIGRADGLWAYRLKFGDEAAADAARTALADNPTVSGSQSNFAIARPDHPEDLALVGAGPSLTLKPRTGADGGQVVVGLVDTAVQTDGTLLKGFLLPEISVAGQANPPADQLTHGSGMAETILYGLARAPDASQGTPVRILPVDVYGNAESTTTFDIAQGIYAAVNGGAAIVNLSLGGDADSPLVHDLIKSAHNQGVIFVASAGNEPVTTPTYPAAYPEVIAVTATAADGQIASYANRGTFVTLAAPGTSIVPFDGQPYMVIGTSTAAANVSALAAALMASTGKSGASLEALLRQGPTAKPPARGP